jgi:hypothetical protein
LELDPAINTSAATLASERFFGNILYLYVVCREFRIWKALKEEDREKKRREEKRGDKKGR